MHNTAANFNYSQLSLFPVLSFSLLRGVREAVSIAIGGIGVAPGEVQTGILTANIV